MSEHISFIPSRIKNAAINGHVAGTEDIFDDSKNKTQKQINYETTQALGSGGSVDTRIAEAVNNEKERAENIELDHNNRIDVLENNVGSGGTVNSRILNAVSVETQRAQTVEQQLQEQYNALTQSDIIIGTLPSSGTKNKIYRVPGTTSYSDYMWNGSSFVKMATYNNAIDNVPIPESNNLVKSGGVFPTQNAINESLFFLGKKISIIGDSISTYDGTMPSGYRTYYPNSSLGVTSIYDMWWHYLLALANASLEVNASWSGSRVTNTRSADGYPDFYDRTNILGDPDCIFVALGTNDSTANVALGDFDFDSDISELSEAKFIPAYIKGVKSLRANYPSARIILLIFQMAYNYEMPIRKIGAYYGLEVIDVNDYYNGTNVHPNKTEMTTVSKYIVTHCITRANSATSNNFVGYNYISEVVLKEKLCALNSIDAETIIGKTYNPYYERVGADRCLKQYKIENGRLVYDSSVYYCYDCVKVIKGDIIRVEAIQNGTANPSWIAPYFCKSIPTDGAVLTLLNAGKNIATIIDQVNYTIQAEEDGYIVFRHFPRNIISFKVFKRVNYTNLLYGGYIIKPLNLPIIQHRVIDVDELSPTYGQDVYTQSSVLNCTDYFDVSSIKYLYINYTKSTSTYIINKQCGVCFYDENYNVIGHRLTFSSEEKGYTMQQIVDIPNGTKYARFTCYDRTDSLGNKTRSNMLYYFKKCNSDTKENQFNGILEEILNTTIFGSIQTTIIPSIADTYNAYYRSSFAENMKADNDENSKYLERLTYFPNYIVNGGESITIKYGGQGGSWRLFELPYIPLDSSVVDAFKTNKIIKEIVLPLSASPDFTGTETITLSNSCRRIAIVWGAGMNTTLNPNDILTYIQEISLSVVDFNNVIGPKDSIIDGNNYFGEKIRFDNKYTHSVYASNSISGQSAAVYGDYLFIPKDKLTSISLYNLKEKRIVYTFNTGYTKDATWHCNQSQFGIDKYDADDMFPLLWITVNNDENGRCSWVSFRIIPVLDEEQNITSFSIEQVQTIHLPAMTDENCLGNFNIAVDYDNKVFWGYGRNNNLEAPNSQLAHFAQFPIPPLRDNDDNIITDVTYEDADIIDQFSDDWRMTYAQGGFIKNGKLVIMQGYSAVNIICCRVIDLYYLKKQISFVNLLADGFTQEPEGVFFYENTVFTATSNTNIHKFVF